MPCVQNTHAGAVLRGQKGKDMQKRLTIKEALSLHKQMWAEMKAKLGDCPSADLRRSFKTDWCREHFPRETVKNNCFLCEYTARLRGRKKSDCSYCPIKWPERICTGADHGYGNMPIREILALPEREVL